MGNSWRALARKCEERIRSFTDQETETILNVSPHILYDPRVTITDISFLLPCQLWYLRLHSLARMRLYNQATVECSNLWAALESQAAASVAEDATSDLREYIFSHLVPFELLVFRARTSYFVKDSYEYLDQLMSLRRDCLKWARQAEDAIEADVWKERCSRIGLLVASQLLEMKVSEHIFPFSPLLPTGQKRTHSRPNAPRTSKAPKEY